jgi:hypothetical protein
VGRETLERRNTDAKREVGKRGAPPGDGTELGALSEDTPSAPATLFLPLSSLLDSYLDPPFLHILVSSYFFFLLIALEVCFIHFSIMLIP